jgi:hypothetical protein
MNQKLSAKPLAQNPLALAAVYRNGLGKTWNNQTEAAVALARISVTRTHINRAARVAAMPAAVLSLFTTVRMLDHTARELIRLERKVGRDEMEQRASQISAVGRSWREIIAMLGGEALTPSSKIRFPSKAPLERASLYAEGLATNLWSTVVEAANITGWERAKLAKAIAISELPSVVLFLFEGKYLSLEIGETLISIKRAIGTETMVRNARVLQDNPKRRSMDELINALAGAKTYSDMTLKMRGTPTRLTFEMTFNVEDADQLIVDAEIVKGMVRSILLNSPRRKL